MGQKKKTAPVHPGEILLQDFLLPMGITQYRLAKDTSAPPRRINEIVKGKRAISADTALRLSRFFAVSERFWLNLQTHYDLEMQKDRLGNRLEREVSAFARDRRGRYGSALYMHSCDRCCLNPVPCNY